MRIRFIKPAETHALRHTVLRPGQQLEEMAWSQDQAEDSFHLGLSIGGHLISVVTFIRERNELLRGWKQYRLRGMATHPEFQGQGAGTKLLHFGIDHLRTLKADLVWCNARESAKAFYGKEGFLPEGAQFDIEGIGVHQLMLLRL
ncbi:MAG: GNAT family N-acetyltransferase [Flavobacteriales bacterium]|nr:GNAT family N-acetyltransferase [Flavobacteriales bacterium]